MDDILGEDFWACGSDMDGDDANIPVDIPCTPDTRDGSPDHQAPDSYAPEDSVCGRDDTGGLEDGGEDPAAGDPQEAEERTGEEVRPETPIVVMKNVTPTKDRRVVVDTRPTRVGRAGTRAKGTGPPPQPPSSASSSSSSSPSPPPPSSSLPPAPQAPPGTRTTGKSTGGSNTSSRRIRDPISDDSDNGAAPLTPEQTARNKLRAMRRRARETVSDDSDNGLDPQGQPIPLRPDQVERNRSRRERIRLNELKERRKDAKEETRRRRANGETVKPAAKRPPSLITTRRGRCQTWSKKFKSVNNSLSAIASSTGALVFFLTVHGDNLRVVYNGNLGQIFDLLPVKDIVLEASLRSQEQNRELHRGTLDPSRGVTTSWKKSVAELVQDSLTNHQIIDANACAIDEFMAEADAQGVSPMDAPDAYADETAVPKPPSDRRRSRRSRASSASTNGGVSLVQTKLEPGLEEPEHPTANAIGDGRARGPSTATHARPSRPRSRGSRAPPASYQARQSLAGMWAARKEDVGSSGTGRRTASSSSLLHRAWQEEGYDEGCGDDHEDAEEEGEGEGEYQQEYGEDEDGDDGDDGEGDHESEYDEDDQEYIGDDGDEEAAEGEEDGDYDYDDNNNDDNDDNNENDDNEDNEDNENNEDEADHEYAEQEEDNSGWARSQAEQRTAKRSVAPETAPTRKSRPELADPRPVPPRRTAPPQKGTDRTSNARPAAKEAVPVRRSNGPVARPNAPPPPRPPKPTPSPPVALPAKSGKRVVSGDIRAMMPPAPKRVKVM